MSAEEETPEPKGRQINPNILSLDSIFSANSAVSVVSDIYAFSSVGLVQDIIARSSAPTFSERWAALISRMRLK